MAEETPVGPLVIVRTSGGWWCAISGPLDRVTELCREAGLVVQSWSGIALRTFSRMTSA